MHSHYYKRDRKTVITKGSKFFFQGNWPHVHDYTGSENWTLYVMKNYKIKEEAKLWCVGRLRWLH